MQGNIVYAPNEGGTYPQMHLPIAFAGMGWSDVSFHYPSAISVSSGSVVTGSVGVLSAVDQTYLQVEETGSWAVMTTFEGLSNRPANIEIVGRYVGNVAHNVKVSVWNYTLGQWDNVSSAAQDIVTNTVDAVFRFAFPSLAAADYISAGQSKVRINHESGAVGTHFFYLDRIRVFDASVLMPLTTADYLVAGGWEKQQELNATAREANGTLTVAYSGLYKVSFGFTCTAAANTDLEVFLQKNGVTQANYFCMRSFSGSAMFGYTGFGPKQIRLAAGDVLRLVARTDAVHKAISIHSGHFFLERIAD